MALPNPDPSLPATPAPIFQDNNFVRGPDMRLNNSAIWGDLQYLLDLINALPGVPVLKYERLTTSGTWSWAGAGSPAFAIVRAIGGGGGGGGGNFSGGFSEGGCGGASGCEQWGIVALSGDVIYTIGTGGSGGASVLGTGGNGSSTIFSSITAVGGIGGSFSSLLGALSSGVGAVGKGYPGNNGYRFIGNGAAAGGAGGGFGGGTGRSNGGTPGLSNSGGGGGAGGYNGVSTFAGGAGGTGFIDLFYIVAGTPATNNPLTITTLDITGTITAGTAFDITASGTNYTFSGAAGNIGASALAFNSNPKYRIERGGNDQRKGSLVNWLSATTFSLSTDILSGEYLQIFS